MRWTVDRAGPRLTADRGRGGASPAHGARVLELTGDGGGGRAGRGGAREVLTGDGGRGGALEAMNGGGLSSSQGRRWARKSSGERR
jgi:hypothetical protein